MQPFQGQLFQLFHWLWVIDCDASSIRYCCGLNIVWGDAQSESKQDMFGLVFQQSDGKITYTDIWKMLTTAPIIIFKATKPLTQEYIQPLSNSLFPESVSRGFSSAVHVTFFTSITQVCLLRGQWSPLMLDEENGNYCCISLFLFWGVNIFKVNILRPSEHKWGYKASRRWFWVNDALHGHLLEPPLAVLALVSDPSSIADAGSVDTFSREAALVARFRRGGVSEQHEVKQNVHQQVSVDAPQVAVGCQSGSEEEEFGGTFPPRIHFFFPGRASRVKDRGLEVLLFLGASLGLLRLFLL